MTRIPVRTKPAPYDVLVEEGAVQNAGKHLGTHAHNGKLFIVTDQNVARQWLKPFQESLRSSGIEAVPYILPAGEQTKNWATLEQLTNWLLDEGAERADTIVALGGGVIGDLTGFAASILKRGCNFVQVPTSLLAQVDSSVGGKTAINCAAGKNLIGSFNQPRFVLIDPLVLKTLPARELRAGYAEVIKYGLINNAPFFDWCEANGKNLINGDIECLSHAIIQSVQSKAFIVAEDEMELTGIRALLNLGHTFGHALEAETGYSEKLVHGEAVAAGMALAFQYSVRRGHCDKAEAQRVIDHLKTIELPFSLLSAGVSAPGQKLVDHMRHDKKMSSGTLPFLLTNGIGQTFVANDVELSDVEAFLNETD